MAAVRIGSLSDLIEAVRGHVGPANVRVAVVDSLRRAPLLLALLAPMVHEYGWRSRVLSFLTHACNIDRELDVIYSVIIPRLRLDLVTPNQNPVPGLRLLGKHTLRVQNFSELADITLAGKIADLVVMVADVADKFKEDGNRATLNRNLDDIVLAIRTMRDSSFSFTMQLSSDDEDDEH